MKVNIEIETDGKVVKLTMDEFEQLKRIMTPENPIIYPEQPWVVPSTPWTTPWPYPTFPQITWC